jgi:hypothetical protein
MKALLGGLLGLTIIGGTAGAAEIKSFYSDLNFDECTTIESDDTGAMSACPGYRGYPVVVGEGDLRFFVTFGVDPLKEKAAEQTLPPFNYVGKKIEWRGEADGDDWRPKATILRWYVTPDEKPKGEVLVVTQLKLGATCQIALIDALAVKDANEKARQIADEKAGDFDCANEPETVQPFKAY